MEGINESPNDIENPYDPLLKELRNLLPLSPLRCIYRVPERLRQGNEKAYTPQVVSIGPLHHGKEHLKAMEEHKKRYLRHFLSRTGVSFFDYIQMIKEQEGRLRGFYAESIEFSSDQFVRIVLMDAAFVIEFLLRNYSINFRDEDDYIFNKPMMKRDVHPDLRLLENQLPFFILQRLVKTPKDVELLVDYGIIENWLGDTKKISTLLHDLGTRVIVSNHYYAALCEDLNNYCRTPRHKWMANLRQNYFNSPWSIISVVAAVILLILTFIQTVCSIKSIA